MKTKKQFTNRILSLALALVMVVGMLPLKVAAAGPFTGFDKYGITITDVYYNTPDGASSLTLYDRGGLRPDRELEIKTIGDPNNGQVTVQYSFSCTGVIEGRITGTFTLDCSCDKTYTYGSSPPKIELDGGYTLSIKMTKSQKDHTLVWQQNGNTHTGTCSVCNEKVGPQNCSGDSKATCTTPGKCTVCSANYIDKNNHTKPNEFTYSVNKTNKTKHDKKYACCGGLVETVAHSNFAYFVSGNVITETCPNDCGYSETATLVYNIGSGTYSYTGSAIQPLKVNYSNNWQGGALDITYQNNTAASTDTSKAIGSIEKDGAKATQSFTIMKATMTGITVNGYSGEYDGKAHSISITADGATVTYSESKDGTYTKNNPSYTQVGSYTVWYKIEKDNYEPIHESATVTINPKPITVKAKDESKTYGESDPALTWEITKGKLVGEEELQNISISRVTGNDADIYAITVSQAAGANPNYDITFEGGTFTIKQKEVDISWGPTTFLPYTGGSLVPQATATNLEAGDECILTTAVVETAEGAGIIPGTWTAKVTALSNDNYKLPESGVRVTAPFQIVNASQNDAPDVGTVDETIDGKADGKITAVDSTMEYRKDGEIEYTAISGTEVTGLADGTYYVRYAAKQYYNASPDKEVVIGVGRKLTVTVPATQTGYTLTAADTELVWHGGTALTFTLAAGYSTTNEFKVSANGEALADNGDGTYTISNAENDVAITVTGVVDNTAPDVTLSVRNVGWKQFINKVTFGLFFKDNVEIKVEATDLGSKIKTVEYLITDTAFNTDDAVKADTSAWTAMTLDENGVAKFSVTEQGKKYVYVRVTDHAGNIKVVSSDGGVVVYTDSTADTTAISFTKTTTDDVSAQVNLNGNTVKDIYNGTASIEYSKDYTVDGDGTIAFKASYLDTLAEGQYTLHVVYNPQGETYIEYTNGAGENINDEPAETTITLTVRKQTGSVAITNDLSKTYDGEAVTAPTYTRNNTDGEVVVEYKVQGADDDTYSVAAPKDAGDYTVRVTVKADEAGFYTEVISEPVNFTISQKDVTIDGVTVEASKVYDGKTDAAITANGTPSANYDGDKLTVTVGEANYADKNVGDGKTVSFSGFALSGDAAKNYNLPAQPADVTADITVRSVTITGAAVEASKVYDGTTAANISDIGILENTVDSDDIAIDDTNAKADYADINVGTGKAVTFSGFALKGEDAGNYELPAQPANVTADITVRPVTITDTAVEASKVYDGNTAATITDIGVLDNTVDGDDIAIDDTNAKANYGDKNVGEGKTVSFSGFALKGDAANNYELTAQPADVTAEIEKKRVNATATAPDKVYDGNTAIDESAIVITFDGILDGETVGYTIKVAWYNGSGVSADKEIPIAFNVTGETAANYAFPEVGDYIAPNYYVEAVAAITAKDISDAKITLGDALTYTGKELTQTVADVTVDGLKVTYTVSGNKATKAGVYKLTVTANGNFAGTKTVLYEIAPDTAAIDDLTVDNVKSSDKEAIEAVKAIIDNAVTGLADDAKKAEYKAIGDKCTALLKNISDTAADMDRINEAVDGYDLATVTSEDKAGLEELLVDIEKQLKSPNLTDEEISELNGNKTAVQDLLAKINGAGEPDKSTDSHSPLTGEDLNLWLWLAVLFVGGVGAFGATFYDRKRKTTAKR